MLFVDSENPCGTTFFSETNIRCLFTCVLWVHSGNTEIKPELH